MGRWHAFSAQIGIICNVATRYSITHKGIPINRKVVRNPLIDLERWLHTLCNTSCWYNVETWLGNGRLVVFSRFMHAENANRILKMAWARGMTYWISGGRTTLYGLVSLGTELFLDRFCVIFAVSISISHFLYGHNIFVTTIFFLLLSFWGSAIELNIHMEALTRTVGDQIGFKKRFHHQYS